MGRLSKRKGARGELEAAAFLNEVLGTAYYRGRQYHGGPGSPDLAGGIPGIHVEVKRTETLHLWPAIRQAEADANPDQVPVVMHRPSRRPWVVIVQAAHLVRLVDAVAEALDALQGAEMPPEGANGGTQA